MALQKQSVNINFGQGLDLKTDPWQVKAGKFLDLQNAIFKKGGLLMKRFGFGKLPSISNDPSFITTYNDSLAAVGTSLQVLSEEIGTWVNRGSIQPVDLSVVQAARASVQLSACDGAVAPNGLACTVYMDSSNNCYYQIVNAATGGVVVSQTTITGARSPRVFSLGNYFVITYLKTVSASPHLQYIAVPIGNPSNPGSAVDISTSVASTTTSGYDGISVDGNLYVAWDGGDVGGAIRATFISSTLSQRNTLVTAGKTANLMSLSVDSTGSQPILWATFWNSGDSKGYSAAFTVSSQLQALLAPTLVINTITVAQLTSMARSGTVQVYYETNQNYSYVATRSDYVSSVSCTSAGVVGSPGVVLRGVGIAGKAFYLDSTAKTYLLVTYSGAFQPTNFLIDSAGNTIAKISYGNCTGLISGQVLPNANLDDDTVTYSYLYKYLAVPVNDAQGVSAPGGVYGQAGVNLVSMTINSGCQAREIANSLHLTGGFIWQFDGNKPVEHGFHLFPEDVLVTTATGSGSLIAQLYYYYAVYAWTDAKGIVHRSAPSIPYGITTTTASSTNTVKVPTLRQTYKTSPNSVRIEIYRWSTAQQIPYLITSQTAPTLNDPTADSITYTDSVADASIAANQILYTFGGTVENTAAPASAGAALYRGRVFSINAENRNVIDFSKVVIQGVPVEFSDLLTLYVAPTTAIQESSGGLSVLSAMDDKLISFKPTEILYFTGNGPDNTGANSDYGDPTYITGTVGCDNPASVVLTPQGLMFQSGNKGIWLLGRDLSTKYIGAEVEDYNDQTVLSAVTVPNTNQVRFTMSGGVTLMYDYYYGQWGTFVGIPAISSTIYAGAHTILNDSGAVMQETPDTYLDGSNPVLLGFTTSWFNLAGLQGYQRAYDLYMLGKFLTPHKLQMQIFYDYQIGVSQQVIITPDNYADVFGSDALFGDSSPFGGPSQVEQWRVFFNQQTCQSFQIKIQELYDPSYGVAAGAGLTISGLDLTIGIRKGWPRLPASRQAG